MDYKKIGKLIQSLRKEKKLSQQELGDKLGVSPKTISKWETGNGLPDISFLKKVSEIFEITIEELLEGNLNNKIKEQKVSKKNRYIWSIIITLILIILLSILIIYNNKEKNNVSNNCIVIRTYYIDNIAKSNDENYLYITVHEYQEEGTYTIKLPKLVSKNLEIGKSYEFTFKTNKKNIFTRTDELFIDSEIIDLKYSDKIGLERTNEYYCN